MLKQQPTKRLKFYLAIFKVVKFLLLKTIDDDAAQFWEIQRWRNFGWKSSGATDLALINKDCINYLVRSQENVLSHNPYKLPSKYKTAPLHRLYLSVWKLFSSATTSFLGSWRPWRHICQKRFSLSPASAETHWVQQRGQQGPCNGWHSTSSSWTTWVLGPGMVLDTVPLPWWHLCLEVNI